MKKEYTPLRQFYAWVGFITLGYFAYSAIKLAIFIIKTHKLLAILE